MDERLTTGTESRTVFPRGVSIGPDGAVVSLGSPTTWSPVGDLDGQLSDRTVSFCSTANPPFATPDRR